MLLLVLGLECALYFDNTSVSLWSQLTCMFISAHFQCSKNAVTTTASVRALCGRLMLSMHLLHLIQQHTLREHYTVSQKIRPTVGLL